MNRDNYGRFLTDAEVKFIQERTERYLQRILASNDKYVHVSTKNCSPRHREEIYNRILSILRITGLQFKEKQNAYYHRTYRIKVL